MSIDFSIRYKPWCLMFGYTWSGRHWSPNWERGVDFTDGKYLRCGIWGLYWDWYIEPKVDV